MRLLSVALLGVSAVAASTPVAPSLAAQQRVVAEIDLNVRRGQSTSSQILGRLDQGDTAEVLVPPKRSGYYHVRTAAGVTGWAWAARLTLVGAPVTPTPTPAPPAPPTPAPPSGAPSTGANSIDPSWTKTPSNAADYTWPEANHAVCEAAGQNGDDATNLMKNRTDEPAAYHAVTWDALESLTFPRNQKSRRGGTTNPWTASELAQLAKYEGTPISVEAYLSGIKEQIPENDSTGVRKKGEATNCGQNTSPRVDWHMYLTKGPNQSHRLSIVVETTPRVRRASEVERRRDRAGLDAGCAGSHQRLADVRSGALGSDVEIQGSWRYDGDEGADYPVGDSSDHEGRGEAKRALGGVGLPQCAARNLTSDQARLADHLGYGCLEYAWTCVLGRTAPEERVHRAEDRRRPADADGQREHGDGP